MGVSSLIGGWLGANAQSDAAKQGAQASLQSAQTSVAAQERMFDKMLALQAPYNKAGVEALGTLTGGEVDPTGGAGQYIESVPEFSYSFDENDPAYKFKLQEAQKAIDAATASRGNYNSRAAINALSDAQQSITADEVTNQFNRQKDIYNIGYGKNLDLFNMASQLGNTDYNALLDIIKIGQGSASSAGGGAVATGQGLSSTYANLASNLANSYTAKGNAWSDFYSGAGAQPLAAYNMYNSFSPSMYSYATTPYYAGAGTYGVNPGSAMWH